jgi:hypothetical protein
LGIGLPVASIASIAAVGPASVVACSLPLRVELDRRQGLGALAGEQARQRHETDRRQEQQYECDPPRVHACTVAERTEPPMRARLEGSNPDLRQFSAALERVDLDRSK